MFKRNHCTGTFRKILNRYLQFFKNKKLRPIILIETGEIENGFQSLQTQFDVENGHFCWV